MSASLEETSMQKDAYGLLHGGLQEPDDHQQSQNANGNHADAYEPEHLVDMYVSLYVSKLAPRQYAGMNSCI